MKHTYKLAAQLKNGRTEREIIEITLDGDGREEHSRAFLGVPEHLRGEYRIDIVTALQRAYQQGGEDRSAELLHRGQVNKTGPAGELTSRDTLTIRRNTMATTTIFEPEKLTQIEEHYRIKLTEHERAILTTSTQLLDPIDRQRRYLLGIALEGRQCPACLSMISQRAAATQVMFSDKPHPDDAYQCARCDARLVWHLTIVGTDYFTVHPDEARPVKK